MKEKRNSIGILKTIWNKSGTNNWEVHSLKGVYLNPRGGFSPDYFKIKNDMTLMTSTPGKVANLFSSFGSTEFLLRQSIVPIVAWNDDDEEIKTIGTGFFISASGLLMTAAHVLRDPVDEGYVSPIRLDKNSHRLPGNLNFGIMLPANPAMKGAPISLHPAMRDANWFMCPFEWTQHWGQEVHSPLLHQKPEFKILVDIAICKVKEHPLIGPYQPLNIGLYKSKVGDRAVAIGYAEMRNIRRGGDDYQPELVVSVGTVRTIYSENISKKQNTTPGPNFEFDAKIPGKMSGSPILVGEGILTKGVVSRSWQDANHATGCLIAPTLNLQLAQGESLIDIMRSKKEGIADIQGPGL